MINIQDTTPVQELDIIESATHYSWPRPRVNGTQGVAIKGPKGGFVIWSNGLREEIVPVVGDERCAAYRLPDQLAIAKRRASEWVLANPQ